ncbi:hypothetical protein AAFF_G00002100, partial [Aldrovandia affinis]
LQHHELSVCRKGLEEGLRVHHCTVLLEHQCQEMARHQQGARCLKRREKGQQAHPVRWPSHPSSSSGYGCRL